MKENTYSYHYRPPLQQTKMSNDINRIIKSNLLALLLLIFIFWDSCTASTHTYSTYIRIERAVDPPAHANSNRDEYLNDLSKEGGHD